MESFVTLYESFLHPFAEISAHTLELIGILIIIIGSFRALVLLGKCVITKAPFHIVADLGKALALALEFKVGAEIIKTVIIHELKELIILSAIILIRALLAFIIHWEIKSEKDANNITESEK